MLKAKKVIALILVITSLISVCCVTVFAAETETRERLIYAVGRKKCVCVVGSNFEYSEVFDGGADDPCEVSYQRVGYSATGRSRLVAGIHRESQIDGLIKIPPMSYVTIKATAVTGMTQYNIPVRLSARTHYEGEKQLQCPIYWGKTVTYSQQNQVLSVRIENTDPERTMLLSYLYLETTLTSTYYSATDYGFNDPYVYYPADVDLTSWRDGLETDRVIQNQNENTDKIISNQDENTDEIVGAIEQQQENEKNEANAQGNDSADQLASAIPNDSQGFINGMSSLISAMSYDGTEAKWQFPQLYLPAIPGVMARTELTSKEYEIDLGYWVQQIPSDILEIVQIVLTIALIIYCFKELYGTISYVLTLKKDGGGE